VIREDHDQEKGDHLEDGFAAVRLTEQAELLLGRVVAQGFGEELLMLLVNLPLLKNRKLLGWVVSALPDARADRGDDPVREAEL